MPKLTQARLKEILHYDPETGVFTWKVSPSKKIKAGVVAGSFRNGYVSIGISGKSYQAHRLAWLYMEGYFPKNIDIDHKDQIRCHNWWSNLRLASRQCNLRNCGNRKDNSSSVKGVRWHKQAQKWYACIGVSGKTEYLGRYESFDNAVCARLAAEQVLNWEGCDSNSPAYRYVKKNIQNKKPINLST